MTLTEMTSMYTKKEKLWKTVSKRWSCVCSGSRPVFTRTGGPVPGSRLRDWGDVQLGRYRLKDGLVISCQTALNFCVAGTVSSTLSVFFPHEMKHVYFSLVQTKAITQEAKSKIHNPGCSIFVSSLINLVKHLRWPRFYFFIFLNKHEKSSRQSSSYDLIWRIYKVFIQMLRWPTRPKWAADLEFHAVWLVEGEADNSLASCNYVLLMIQKASEEHFSERTYALLPKAMLTGLWPSRCWLQKRKERNTSV